ncbi:hypothetical protein N9U01_02235 [Paracoccaceae bacterium]|nr:hypothetical protein [Paracoccaceae bacterium]
MKELNEFEHNGWIKFGYDQRLVRWAKLANSKIIAKQKNKESFENSLTCEGTWFVGVDALGNNPDGTLDGIPLQGPFESLMKSYKAHSLHSAQISIIFQGYPKPRDQESESSFNFRLKRDAAHIDGLIADFPGGPRKLKEPHAYVLGIPLNQAPKGASPVVVWEGSHHLVSEAFERFFLNRNPNEWVDIDIREVYLETRKRIFKKCKRRILHANLGESYMVHRLCLHGISPWDFKTKNFNEGRKIAYFRPELQDMSSWPKL